ncbi:hypothetical protein [Robertkochia solimangrovi]|uniref:hypothetical protein n=1 Tax=Robertkochia solimangrovi TaxID=2213046 RepID=UPI00118108E9|nr:hypothetical protein [Robertkochia solimangrovi]TRZ44261.1 hypothetical protein DMZ48_07030 [Robertkochia solimangrovi]
MHSKNTLFIDCKEAVRICDKAQYDEAGLWEKFKLRLHHAYCSSCRKHSVKNGELTKLCDKANLKCMDPAKKKALKDEIRSACSKES